MQRVKNPVLKNVDEKVLDRTNTATYLGVSVKTGILLLFTVLSGVFAWILLNSNPEAALTILAATFIVSLISVLIASFVPRLAMPFSILYSAAQGFSLGLITIVADMAFPGIGMNAVIITVVIFGVMLALYSSRTIRATSKFRKMMYTIMLSILVFSILSLIISPLRNMFVENTGLALLLSGFLIVYGAFMLILNFDQAEQIVTHGAPKNYEWTVSLGLMITIFWIYIEVLRFLFIILSSRE